MAPLLLQTDGPFIADRVPAVLDAMDPDWRADPKIKAILGKLLARLSDRDAAVRRAALATLGKVGPFNGLVPALDRVAKQDADPNLRQTAKDLLEKAVSRS